MTMRGVFITEKLLFDGVEETSDHSPGDIKRPIMRVHFLLNFLLYDKI